MAQIEETINRLCAEETGIKVAYVIQTPEGLLSQDAEHPLLAASLIKLAIAAYGASQRLTESELTQIIRLRDEDIVGGAGTIRLLNQREYNLADLTTLMLRDSDNTAANALIDFYGLEAINDWLKWNFPGAELNRHFMSPIVNGDNTTTPLAILSLLKTCLNQSNNKYYRLINNALSHSTSTLQLAYPLVTGEFSGEVANKTGSLATVAHDAARLTIGQQSVDAVVMTTFSPERRNRAIVLEQRISRALLLMLTA